MYSTEYTESHIQQKKKLMYALFYDVFFYRKSEFPAKKSVRPFSQYAYDIKFKHGHTEKENFGFATDAENKIDNKTLVNGGHVAQTWYRDVVELRKKAEEYKVRFSKLYTISCQVLHVFKKTRLTILSFFMFLSLASRP